MVIDFYQQECARQAWDMINHIATGKKIGFVPTAGLQQAFDDKDRANVRNYLASVGIEISASASLEIWKEGVEWKVFDDQKQFNFRRRGGEIDIYQREKQLEQPFRSQVRNAPAMIQKNGLGQFLAFLAAKGFQSGDLIANPRKKTEYYAHACGRLYQYLGRWMLKAIREVSSYPAVNEVGPGRGHRRDPLDFLLERCSVEQLMWATREVQLFLQWARRFAESQLEAGDKQGES